MKYLSILALAVMLVFQACNSGKKAMQTSENTKEAMEVRELDTMTISASKKEKSPNEAHPQPVYQATQTRTIDLIHTRLDLAFDFQQEHVLGEAWIDFSAIFDPVREVVLDAKYFDIHAVKDQNGNSLAFSYEDSLQLRIALGESVGRFDTSRIYIDYTAVPDRRPSGGSSAIMSNKGLFFINPRGEVEGKPTQIWTQGETEHNSNWFPTVDQPNERTTQELSLTVPVEMETLSNGLLMESTVVNDTLRRDRWVLDQPHAPYLFMIAVGDFAIVRDSWKEIPVSYYVEHDYKANAAGIFDHTPEMLTYFSEILDYPYPWPKYDQVVVRDFVSGAMENTTGVVFGDFVQKYRLDMPGNDNDFIVAHEMFHHWFGDLVTCESWANLTMNEGFANYSEYLWKEYKEGRGAADVHRDNQIQGYMREASQKIRPLIDFEYMRAEQMFDAHSYNKGGLVLHMLRDYLGDEKFFAGLNLFLEEHKYSAVEAHDLRLVMEEISGEDLNWFFNQWFFDKGHPELLIKESFLDGTFTLTIDQVQDPEKHQPIFQLPVAVDVYDQNGQRQRHSFMIDQRRTEWSVDMEAEPALVVFDPNDVLLAEIQHEKSKEEYARQFRNSNVFRHQKEALRALASADETLRQEIFREGINSEHAAVRRHAVKNLRYSGDKATQSKLLQLATQDPSVNVRIQAMKQLDEMDGFRDLLEQKINDQRSGLEMGEALKMLYRIDSLSALQYANKLEDVKSELLWNAILDVYADVGDPGNIDFFDRLLPDQSGFSSFPFFNAYSQIIAKLPEDKMSVRIDRLYQLGGNQAAGTFTRYAATKALKDVQNALGEEDEAIRTAIQEKIDDIVERETSSRLKAMYSSF